MQVVESAEADVIVQAAEPVDEGSLFVAWWSVAVCCASFAQAVEGLAIGISIDKRILTVEVGGDFASSCKPVRYCPWCGVDFRWDGPRIIERAEVTALRKRYAKQLAERKGSSPMTNQTPPTPSDAAPAPTDAHTIGGSTFGYSGAQVDALTGASAYTVVCIAVDTSSSVAAFERDLERCLKDVVAALRRSPCADNLILRVVTFGNTVTELHGFQELKRCPPGSYEGKIHANGWTALYDAAFSAIGSVDDYGAKLVADDYAVNGIVFVITDGCDNRSKVDVASVGERLKAARKAGVMGPAAEGGLESILTYLIGVNITDPQVTGSLAAMQREVAFDAFVDLKDASPKTIAKLAGFISSSVVAQSQATGSGAASVQVDPTALTL